MKKFGQFRKTRGFTIDSKYSITTVISTLLKLCGPFAVILAIITVVVFSFKSVTRRTVSHINQECAKISPSLTNFNSSSSIIEKIRAVWIITSGAHVFPSGVKIMLKRSFGTTVFYSPRSSFGRTPISKTATRGYVPFGQMGAANGFRVPAVAFAQGCPTTISTQSKIYNNELAKPESDEVKFSGHNVGIINFMSSDGTLNTFRCDNPANLPVNVKPKGIS